MRWCRCFHRRSCKSPWGRPAETEEPECTREWGVWVFLNGFPENEQNEECSNCVSLKWYRACTDCGFLYTPEGILIQLVFHDNLCHIPMWWLPIIVTLCTDLPSLYPVVKVHNYYRSLDPTSPSLVVTNETRRQLLLLLQHCVTKDIGVLLNKDSSTTVYTVLM